MRRSFDERLPDTPYNFEPPSQIPLDAEMVLEEMNFGDVWRAGQQQPDDKYDDRLQPEQIFGLDPRRVISLGNSPESTRRAREESSDLQPPETANISFVPPLSLSVPGSFPSQMNDSEMAFPPHHAEIKEEPAPSRPVSPIDADAPPLSLYEQLGLPSRTSGALRVPRPRFGKEEQTAKDRWSKVIANNIRWVRGRESGFLPLVVGNIFWR